MFGFEEIKETIKKYSLVDALKDNKSGNYMLPKSYEIKEEDIDKLDVKNEIKTRLKGVKWLARDKSHIFRLLSNKNFKIGQEFAEAYVSYRNEIFNELEDINILSEVLEGVVCEGINPASNYQK